MKKILMIAGALWLSVQTQAQEVNKTFTGISKIKMNTASGSCRIVKGTGSEVNVKLTYTYDKDTYKPVLEQEGTTLILKEEFEGRNHSGSSKWTLTLPDNIDLNFNTGSGDLDVSDVAITMKSNTGSGNIDLQKITGNVKINTGSGNITLQNH
ncbi:MAG: DUF4097 domain-containing protein [Bacteroidia bacterium]|nr:DUF4097 domain-containing protein [Bacteroidia bacterium]